MKYQYAKWLDKTNINPTGVVVNTIEQIHEKMNILHEKNKLIYQKSDQYHYEMMCLQCEIRTLQSEVDTLLHDIAYDYQLENFLTKQA